jgi:phosphoribosylaminoimidazolecarboxamide formyltransferase/IMP cyclohydrolase
MSASDKTGLAVLAWGLAEIGVELMASGGTARFLQREGLKVEDLTDYIGYPELIGGRVKTLHPLIHAGILALRKDENHRVDLDKHGIKLIDLVVVNLYPFEQKVTNNTLMEEAMALVDIGGEALIRAAAKNHRWVGVLVDPASYAPFLDELSTQGGLSPDHSRRFAEQAFDHIIHYNAAIAHYLSTELPPQQLNLAFPKAMSLRAGENSHQKAAFYSDSIPFTILQGKNPSYNNLLDLDAALRISHAFSEPAAVVIKHTNPCGLATAETIEDAFSQAHAADSKSAFGGIVGLNRPLTKDGANLLTKHFLDALIAPDYEPEALGILKGRENLLVLRASNKLLKNELALEIKDTAFGLVTQSPSTGSISRDNLRLVSNVQPTETQLDELIFSWKAVRWVKSNAVLLAKDHCTTGIGAGQMSRVDAVELAIRKAGNRANGSVLASDAFFPFRDSIDLAAAAGITAIIEPGGSVRDDEVIAASDEHDIPLVFTGRREFRH